MSKNTRGFKSVKIIPALNITIAYLEHCKYYINY